VLTSLGLISEAALADALSKFLDAPLVGAEDFPDEPVLPGALSPRFLKAHCMVPLSATVDALVLATAEAIPNETIDAVRYSTGRTVALRVATRSAVAEAHERLYGQGAAARRAAARGEGPGDGPGAAGRRPGAAPTVAGEENGGGVPGRAEATLADAERLKDLASEAPVIRLVNRWLAEAMELRASDIHIQPGSDAIKLRFRVDGLLRDMETPESRLGPAVASRIKIMARLDIAERRLPQDGKFRMAVKGREIDVRVSTIPTVHGESIVLRILDKDQAPLDFAGLGFAGDVLDGVARRLGG
jgi:general secretion pathway protein E